MYNAKTLFTGYKIGLGNADAYVGVPKKYIKDGVRVIHNGEQRDFKSYQIKHEETFPDKFDVNKTYTLAYFLWEKR